MDRLLLHWEDMSDQIEARADVPRFMSGSHPISKKCCGGEVHCSAGNSNIKYLQVRCTVSFLL